LFSHVRLLHTACIGLDGWIYDRCASSLRLRDYHHPPIARCLRRIVDRCSIDPNCCSMGSIFHDRSILEHELLLHRMIGRRSSLRSHPRFSHRSQTTGPQHDTHRAQSPSSDLAIFIRFGSIFHSARGTILHADALPRSGEAT
jgi:hypothetical protein